MSRPPLKCVICDSAIEVDEHGWEFGHNAEPVKDGRCCTRCQWNVVLPARINQAREQERAERAALK